MKKEIVENYLVKIVGSVGDKTEISFDRRSSAEHFYKDFIIGCPTIGAIWLIKVIKKGRNKRNFVIDNYFG